ncbi:stalk domain-containing protein [Paenibacillus sp. HGF5]|uniref:stalk domain-containing protein n=1 Tax=Paenibacillus sp. HGF5 TaxID=908341 RepID=UPI00020730C9|nr:stalk domain-containing protein [Paenibacillus sp. HGF5]EGG34017.1 ankyrin repeat protein [Paenibacillus sp. HGF5]
MKKRFSSVPAFALGAIVGVSLTAGTAVGAAVYLKAFPSQSKIVVNGSEARLSDSPVVIQNKLYVPVRDFSEALGYRVGSVGPEGIGIIPQSSNGEAIPVGPTAPSESEGAPAHERHLVKNLGKLIEVNGELNMQKIYIVIAAGEARLYSQDETTGNGLLHYLILDGDSSLYDPFVQMDGQAGELDYNLPNFEGQTPLHLAVIHKNDFYIDKLLNQHKADASLQDASGKTALDYAEKDSKQYKLLTAYINKNSQ